MIKELTDEEILKNIINISNLKKEEDKKRVRDSYALIVERYEDKLTRYIRKFIYDATDAEDVLQDVFIKAYQNLNSFNFDFKFNSWIYRITHNECVNYLKKNKKEGISFVDLDLVMPTLFAKESSDSLTLLKENQKDIEEALKKIDIKYREVLILNFFEDMSYEEISDILRIPTSTVGVRIKRAKDKLKQFLPNHQN